MTALKPKIIIACLLLALIGLLLFLSGCSAKHYGSNRLQEVLYQDGLLALYGFGQSDVDDDVIANQDGSAVGGESIIHRGDS